MKNLYRGAMGAVALAGASLASATSTAVDVTATVTSIADQLVPIGLIGTAVLAVIVAVKAFKWIRRAF